MMIGQVAVLDRNDDLGSGNCSDEIQVAIISYLLLEYVSEVRNDLTINCYP